jgi:uncharacterized protein (TIGR02246 family)
MPNDEAKIRAVITEWHAATAAGDIARILPLMSEDVVFLQPGQPPMRGRDAFAAGFAAALKMLRIGSTFKIQEMQLVEDMAYCWTRLSVTVTPLNGGPAKVRSGYTLTIFRKRPTGDWVLTRDANMLTLEATS